VTKEKKKAKKIMSLRDTSKKNAAGINLKKKKNAKEKKKKKNRAEGGPKKKRERKEVLFSPNTPHRKAGRQKGFGEGELCKTRGEP